MHNSNIPSQLELPSSARLVKSTIVAALTASILLVCVVMPAEYGKDPTGIGEFLGLQKMGEIKVALAREAAMALAKEATAGKPAETISQTVLGDIIMSHEIKVTLAANESTEIKLKMTKGDQTNFSWRTDKGQIFYDLHGDSKELKINYHIYNKGTKQQDEGILVAAFDGNHGWYWKNRTSEVITITLQTDGQYLDIQQMN